jgi:hypothetical protein
MLAVFIGQFHGFRGNVHAPPRGSEDYPLKALQYHDTVKVRVRVRVRVRVTVMIVIDCVTAIAFVEA